MSAVDAEPPGTPPDQPPWTWPDQQPEQQPAAPTPSYRVEFDVLPSLVDPEQIGRRTVLAQVTDPTGRRTWILSGIVVVVMLAVAALTGSMVLGLAAVFLAMFLPAVLVLSARSIAAAIRAKPSFGERGRFVVATDGVHDLGRDSEMHLGWRHLSAAAIVADHLVLTVRGGGGRVFVPLAALDPAHDAETVLGLVRASIDAAAPPS